MEDTMKKGMTPEEVEQLGNQTEEAGQTAQQLFTQIQSRVTDFDWTGEDRDRYVSEFEGNLGQMVQQIVQQATEFGERARRNAAEQREIGRASCRERVKSRAATERLK